MSSPIYLNSPPPFPFIELQEDRQLQFFIPPQYQASSSLSSSIFHNITQGHRATQAGETPKDQQIKARSPSQADMYILHGGSSNYQQVFPSSSSHPTVDDTKDVNELSISELVDGADEDKRDGAEPGRWMSSKMRLMQKMMSAGADKQDRVVQKFCDEEKEKSRTNLSPRNNNSNNNNVRICCDCNTTKTPLWRSGPQGPKSLCNACGIRKRKARRAMEAAAAAAAARNCGAALATDNSAAIAKGQNKEKKSRTSCVPQYKKAPLRAQSGEKVSFEDFAVSMSNNSALGRAFPKDEEEAAILLMALSYGLLHSR